jgi:hypothetical protein
MATFFFILILVLVLFLLIRGSQKPANKIPAEKGEVFEHANHACAISGQGLFYAFYPSPMSLQCAELTGISSLVLEDPRLKEFQIRYGPVDQVDADNFAEEARYCQSSSETVIPIGSVTAFAGRVITPPPLENGFCRLVRIDAEGHRDVCSREETTPVYISGLAKDAKGNIFPAQFFLSVSNQKLNLSSQSVSKTIEIRGLSIHPKESDGYWVSERIESLSESLSWALSTDKEILDRFIDLRSLAKRAQSNPLMENSRSKINNALLEARDLADQMPELLRELEKKAVDVLDWMLLPEEFKGDSSVREIELTLTA